MSLSPHMMPVQTEPPGVFPFKKMLPTDIICCQKKTINMTLLSCVLAHISTAAHRVWCKLLASSQR